MVLGSNTLSLRDDILEQVEKKTQGLETAAGQVADFAVEMETAQSDISLALAGVGTLTPAPNRVTAGISGGVTDRRVPTIDAGAAPYNLVAQSVPDTDFAAELQGAIDDGHAMGGADILLPGKVGIADGVSLKTGVRLVGHGTPQYETLTANQRGAWLCWTGANDGSGVMVHAGKSDQTSGVHGAGIDGVGLDGMSKDVTCLSIQSNTPVSAIYVTKFLHFQHTAMVKAGRGVTWGDGRIEQQADFIGFDFGHMYHMSEYGAKINSSNSADASYFKNFTFVNCSPAAQAYIKLTNSGYLTLENVSGGGDGASAKDFIEFTALSSGIRLIAVQTEKMRNWLVVTGNNDANPIVLEGCYLDDDCLINGIVQIRSYGSTLKGKIRLAAAGAKWLGVGDVYNESLGFDVIQHASADWVHHRSRPASNNSRYIQGDRVALKPTTTLPTKTVEICTRTGRRASVWAASTALTPAGQRTWVPSTAYAVNDIVLPGVMNGTKYRCTVAGTSAATEPDFRKWLPVSGIVDGGVTWVADGSQSPSPSATIYRVPTTDNGHIYKLVTAGTTGGSEPTWPTTAGATVTDGTCVWQESGPSAAFAYEYASA